MNKVLDEKGTEPQEHHTGWCVFGERDVRLNKHLSSPFIVNKGKQLRARAHAHTRTAVLI